MSVSTAAGAKFFIGTTTPADTEAEFAADTYTEVKEVEDLGELGDESEAVTWAPIGERRIQKLKGARDAGTIVLVVGRDPLDAGQAAMRAAEQTDFEHNFKIVANDAPDAGGTDSTIYFRGLVMSRRDGFGQQANVIRTTFNVAVNSGLIEVLAEAGA